ncbi:hypothetical protein NKI12_31425 [Mesorhizobium australicum]|uniref:Uncharacterized protein n=1 Tax=Mesorhizobium australicum TaxID=536018 RepID=A0ACC6T8M9_9HYPH
MPARLRLLVVGAFATIVAGVGYYVLGQYRSHQQGKEATLQQLVDKALRQGCLDDLKATLSIPQSHPYEVANCLRMGYLSEAEVKSREDHLGIPLR